YDYGTGRVVVLNRATLQDAALYNLWAEVLTRAELTADGLLMPLSEEAWEQKRAELAARLASLDGIEADILKGTTEYRHSWPRAGAEESNAKGSGRRPPPPSPRLSAVDPPADSLHTRASLYEFGKNKRWDLAAAGRLEARKLAKATWTPASMDSWAWLLVKDPKQSPETYRAALRVAEEAYRDNPDALNFHPLATASYPTPPYPPPLP